MRDRQLERQLRRINGDFRPPRALPAMIVIVALAGMAAVRPPQSTTLTLLLVSVIAAAAWLDGYDRVRPRGGAIVRQLVLGAFLGGCVAGLVMVAPPSAQDWLRTPVEHGAPAGVVVMVAAMIEDLIRTGLRRIARRE